jgi:hypothetical protein
MLIGPINIVDLLTLMIENSLSQSIDILKEVGVPDTSISVKLSEDTVLQVLYYLNQYNSWWLLP